MVEELLQYIWKTKRINLLNLSTTDGEALTILEYGIHNHNAGPDFINGKIKINETTWVGHIEIHVKSSEWNAHKHQNDEAYNNVILHVVNENDKDIQNKNGQAIPTLEIKDRYDPSLLKHYSHLMMNQSWVPCAGQLPQTDKKGLPFFLERLVTDRLIRKGEQIAALLKDSKNDWEEVLYKTIMRYLGLKVNGGALARLAEVMPLSTLRKQESLIQKESALFGQAGLLKSQDDYFVTLEREYKHQKHKYNLQSMTGVEWRFSRLRPANFPTIRIAQVAALYHQKPQLFNEVISNPSYEQLSHLLEVKASEYWDNHYSPGKAGATKVKKIGLATKDLLIINAFAPILFAYGMAKSAEEIKVKAIDLLARTKPEQNSIIREWRNLGVIADSANQSQALIELKTNYCNMQKCLRCHIGQQIINS